MNNNPLDPTLRELNACGCCAGTTPETPAVIDNRPGLSAIAFRVGTQPRFKTTLLAALSDALRPVLARLRTREDDDFSIALLDAWVTVADVLSFYSERIANESYLRTATERRSVLELARAIGYELKPGVAAETYLAFTMDESPGARLATTVDIGTKVQSIPGPGEKPQTYETIEKIEARAEWNVLQPQQTDQQRIDKGLRELYLKGVNTQLKPGDAILLVGDKREGFPGSEVWDVRIVQTVTTYPGGDPDKTYTLVTWETGLGHDKPTVCPADNPKVFAFRQRAALFGQSAPDYRIMPDSVKRFYDPTYNPDSPDRRKTQWPDFGLKITEENEIDLDTTYPKIVVGSWVALIKPGYTELYRVQRARTSSRTDFTLTAQVTRIKLDATEHLSWFDLRDTLVLAQTEQLVLIEKTITDPIWGKQIVLSQLAQELMPTQTLIVSGKRTRVQIASTAKGLKLVSTDGTKRDLSPSDLLMVMSPPALIIPGGAEPIVLKPDEVVQILAGKPPQSTAWQLVDRDGFVGYVTVPSDQISLQPAAKDDPIVSEIAFIDSRSDAISSDRDHTTITLSESLQNCYDRSTVTINANVARTTHGESVKNEILGSGDATQLNQRFTLKQKPLTYTPSSDLRSTTTLEIWVNEIKWQEVDSLYNAGPNDRVYITRLADDGTVSVESGDGIHGARLPTGIENVKAIYRKGSGTEGRVKADQLSLLMTRPLGVKSVTNPEPSENGADPQQLADARCNAPLTVLTLDRIVSLQDYEDFARNFFGIAKALAIWTWNENTRGVFITVAGTNGERADDTTIANLKASLAQRGNPLVPVDIRSYVKKQFQIQGIVYVAADRDPDTVGAAVKDFLKTQFSFDAREFGQGVALSEVLAAIQGVPGVEAVGITDLQSLDIQSSSANPALLIKSPSKPVQLSLLQPLKKTVPPLFRGGIKLPPLPSKDESYLPAAKPENGAAAGSVNPAEVLTLDETCLSNLEVKSA
ncbi:MAG: putative baseplate assembly protein [Bacteroidota bacterium]